MALNWEITHINFYADAFKMFPKLLAKYATKYYATLIENKCAQIQDISLALDLEFQTPNSTSERFIPL